MDDQLCRLYELTLLIRQELTEGLAELETEVNNSRFNANTVLSLALKQEQLTHLLKFLLRELLADEPILLDQFDERMFALKLTETLQKQGIAVCKITG